MGKWVPVTFPVYPLTCLGSNQGVLSARVEVTELRWDFLEHYGRVVDSWVDRYSMTKPECPPPIGKAVHQAV